MCPVRIMVSTRKSRYVLCIYILYPESPYISIKIPINIPKHLCLPMFPSPHCPAKLQRCEEPEKHPNPRLPPFRTLLEAPLISQYGGHIRVIQDYRAGLGLRVCYVYLITKVMGIIIGAKLDGG